MEKVDKESLLFLEIARSEIFKKQLDSSLAEKSIDKKKYKNMIDLINIENIRIENYLFSTENNMSQYEGDNEMVLNNNALSIELSNYLGDLKEPILECLSHLSKFKCTQGQAFCYLLAKCLPTLFVPIPDGSNNNDNWFYDEDKTRSIHIVWGGAVQIFKEKYLAEFSFSSVDEFTGNILRDKLEKDSQVYFHVVNVFNKIIEEKTDSNNEDRPILFSFLIRKLLFDCINRITPSIYSEIRGIETQNYNIATHVNDGII